MEEKRVWMVLCLGLVAALVVMTIFLLQNTAEIDLKSKYKELGEKYNDLAGKHSRLLEKVKNIIENLDKDSLAISQAKGTAQPKTVEQWNKEKEEIQKTIQERKAEADRLISDYEDMRAVDVAVGLLKRDIEDWANKK